MRSPRSIGSRRGTLRYGLAAVVSAATTPTATSGQAHPVRTHGPAPWWRTTGGSEWCPSCLRLNGAYGVQPCTPNRLGDLGAQYFGRPW